MPRFASCSPLARVCVSDGMKYDRACLATAGASMPFPAPCAVAVRACAGIGGGAWGACELGKCPEGAFAGDAEDVDEMGRRLAILRNVRKRVPTPFPTRAARLN